jgi:imidazolonepropionase-like amidohydrolase
MKIMTMPALLALLVMTAAAQEPVIAIHAKGMIDVTSGRLINDATVVVRGKRIAAAGPSASITVPGGASIVQLPTMTLLPGLIDAHVHLTLAGDPVANARATLEAGFTTVQDLGSQPYGNITLRDDIAAGKVVGPRVIASGPWLGIAGGICEFNGLGVKGADAFRARVRADVEHGADLIKVCVSGWLGDAVNRPAQYEISDAELVAAIDEAHRHRKRVAVHAISAGGIAAAVNAGADLVVHGGFPSVATVATMKQKRIYDLPTLFSLTRTSPPDAAAALVEAMKTASAAGLPIAFGTDAGVIRHGNNAREFESLVSIGLDPAAAIRTATINAAAAVGKPNDIGVLAKDRFADVIAVEGDPLSDVKALQQIAFVMKEGAVIKGPSPTTPKR